MGSLLDLFSEKRDASPPGPARGSVELEVLEMERALLLGEPAGQEEGLPVVVDLPTELLELVERKVGVDQQGPLPLPLGLVGRDGQHSRPIQVLEVLSRLADDRLPAIALSPLIDRLGQQGLIAIAAVG